MSCSAFEDGPADEAKGCVACDKEPRLWISWSVESSVGGKGRVGVCALMDANGQVHNRVQCPITIIAMGKLDLLTVVIVVSSG